MKFIIDDIGYWYQSKNGFNKFVRYTDKNKPYWKKVKELTGLTDNQLLRIETN